MTTTPDDEALALEIAEEAAEAGKDRGLMPSQVANVLVQAAMQILETNPPSDHKQRPMWLADSVAGIRSALDNRLQNVVGMKELFAGTLSPLTVAVLTALVRRTVPDGEEIHLAQFELATTADLSWSMQNDPNRITLKVMPHIDNPQQREEGEA